MTTEDKENLKHIIHVLKKNFPNLTTDKVLEIALEIMDGLLK